MQGPCRQGIDRSRRLLGGIPGCRRCEPARQPARRLRVGGRERAFVGTGRESLGLDRKSGAEYGLDAQGHFRTAVMNIQNVGVPNEQFRFFPVVDAGSTIEKLRRVCCGVVEGSSG